MVEPITSAYVELRNGGYYIAKSQVSLASVVHAFRQGASPETILQDFPHIGSLANVYGAITFILENPAVVDLLRARDSLCRQTPSADGFTCNGRVQDRAKRIFTKHANGQRLSLGPDSICRPIDEPCKVIEIGCLNFIFRDSGWLSEDVRGREKRHPDDQYCTSHEVA